VTGGPHAFIIPVGHACLLIYSQLINLIIDLGHVLDIFTNSKRIASGIIYFGDLLADISS